MKKAKGGASKKERLGERRDELDGTWAVMQPNLGLVQPANEAVQAITAFRDALAADTGPKAAILAKLEQLTGKELKALEKVLGSHCEETRTQALSDAFFKVQTENVGKSEKVVVQLKRAMKTMSTIAVFETYMSDEGRMNWEGLKADVVDTVETVARRQMQV
jgi:hypothetical protein